MVHILRGARDAARDGAERDVRAHGQAGQCQRTAQYAQVKNGFFQLQAAHFFRRAHAAADVLSGQLRRRAGHHQRDDDGIHQILSQKEVDQHRRNHRGNANQFVFLHHAQRQLRQHQAHARHHGVQHGFARKVHNGRKQPARAQRSHRHACEEYHRKALAHVFAHRARQHDRLGLERDRSHRTKQQAADNAHAKPQRRRHRGKAHGKRQQPLRDAVEHDADRRKDIL